MSTYLKFPSDVTEKCTFFQGNVNVVPSNIMATEYLWSGSEDGTIGIKDFWLLKPRRDMHSSSCEATRNINVSEGLYFRRNVAIAVITPLFDNIMSKLYNNTMKSGFRPPIINARENMYELTELWAVCKESSTGSFNVPYYDHGCLVGNNNALQLCKQYNWSPMGDARFRVSVVESFDKESGIVDINSVPEIIFALTEFKVDTSHLTFTRGMNAYVNYNPTIRYGTSLEVYNHTLTSRHSLFYKTL